MAETNSDERELETAELESFMLNSSSDESEMEMVELFVGCVQSENESVGKESAQQRKASSFLPSTTDSPLYEGSEITVFESHLLLFQFSVRHSSSAKAFGELLQVVSAHLPPTAKFPKSVYTLKWFFRSLFPDLSTRAHSYCSCCLKLLEEGTQCENHNCVSAKVETFITMPLESQLKENRRYVHVLILATCIYLVVPCLNFHAHAETSSLILLEVALLPFG